MKYIYKGPRKEFFVRYELYTYDYILTYLSICVSTCLSEVSASFKTSQKPKGKNNTFIFILYLKKKCMYCVIVSKWNKENNNTGKEERIERN